MSNPKSNIHFLLFLLSLVFSSCYVTKILDTNVNVYLTTDFEVDVFNSAESTFSSNYTIEEYKKSYLTGLESELATANIYVVDDGGIFNVFVNKVKISESSSYKSVEDADSPDDADTYLLSSVSVYAAGYVLPNDSKNSKSWYADKSKEESITNNRSAIDYSVGTNKDGKSYRKKSFDDDITQDLAYKCGRRSGVRIVKIISKMRKNK